MTAIAGGLGGYAQFAIIRALAPHLFMPPYLIEIIIHAFNLVLGVAIILKFESWGFWYLIGWLIGQWIMAYTEFIESELVILFTIVGLFVLISFLVKYYKQNR